MTKSKTSIKFLTFILAIIIVLPHLFIWIYAKHERQQWQETLKIIHQAKEEASNYKKYLLVTQREKNSKDLLIIEQQLNGLPLLQKFSSLPALSTNLIKPNRLNLIMEMSQDTSSDQFFSTQTFVPIDTSDLCNILKIIEKGLSSSIPFFPTEFTFQRNPSPTKEALYDLNLTLLKRES